MGPTELKEVITAKMMAIMGIWFTSPTDRRSPSLATTMDTTIVKAPANCVREMSLFMMNL